MKRTALGLVAAALLASCAPSSPQTGGTTQPAEARADSQILRVGVTGLIGNPTPQSSSSNIYQFWPMYDSLTKFGKDYEVQPAIAEKWTLGADGRTWQFTIRNDVTWPNGDKLTAEDVAFTVNTIIQRNWPQRSFIANATAAVAVSATQVDIQQRQPDMSVPNAGPYLWIVPKAYYESIGFEAFVTKPMGSGPYELVEFKAADTMRYRKRAAAHAFRKPEATELVFRAIPETTQIVAGLQAGEIDIAAQVNFTGEQIERLPASNISVISNLASIAGFSIMQGGYEARNSPLKDRRVRLALNYAVDKEAISKSLYRGQAVPTGQLAIPGSAYFDPDVKPIPFDVARAKALLTEAGYPNGFKLPVGIDFTPGMTRPDIVVAVQSYLKDIGVQAEAVQSELGVFVDKRYGRNNQVPADISSGGSGDGNGFFTQTRTFNGCGKPVGGSPESMSYCNPEWDRLLDQAYAEPDAAKRGALLRQANKVYRDDVPSIFFLAQPVYVVHTAKVKAVSIPMPLAYSFDTAYLIK